MEDNIEELKRADQSFHMEKVFGNGKGHRDVSGIVCYPLLNKIVTTATQASKHIIIWNVDKGTIEAEITKHLSIVNDMCKWNNTSFITVSTDNMVYSWSVFPPYEPLKKFSFNRDNVNRVEKLDDDIFVTRNCKNELYVICYSQNEVVQLISNLGDIGYSKIVKSLKDPSFFYIDCRRKNEICLINYKKKNENYVERSINLSDIHKERGKFYATNVFLNSKQQENVVIVDSYHTLYFFNTSTNQHSHYQLIEKDENNMMSYRIHRSLMFSNYFLTATKEGTFYDSGRVNFFLLQISEENSENGIIPKSKLFMKFESKKTILLFPKGADYSSEIVIWSKNTNSCVFIVGGNKDGNLYFVKIGNLILGNSGQFVEEDLNERISFLREDVDWEGMIYEGKQMKTQEVLIDVKLRNLDIPGIWKCFLLQ